MSRLRYLNPFRIRAAVREIRKVAGAGGPRKLRLVSVGHPEGWLVPTSEIVLEVEAKDGSVSKFAPALPVPWPYAWAYRVARKLGVPLIKAYEPERAGFEVGVPRRG